MLFFVLAVGSTSAQNHKWVEISNPLDGYGGADSIDVNNIERLPNGNVTYFWKTAGYTIYQSEVNCQIKQIRTLSETELDYRDAYGNLVRATPSKRSFPSEWRTIGDGSDVYFLAIRACRSAKSIAIQPAKSATKKIVKKKLRRKQ
jgi:hypothetical protein